MKMVCKNHIAVVVLWISIWNHINCQSSEDELQFDFNMLLLRNDELSKLKSTNGTHVIDVLIGDIIRFYITCNQSIMGRDLEIMILREGGGKFDCAEGIYICSSSNHSVNSGQGGLNNKPSKLLCKLKVESDWICVAEWISIKSFADASAYRSYIFDNAKQRILEMDYGFQIRVNSLPSWSEWSEWSACNQFHGDQAHRTRERSCRKGESNPLGGLYDGALCGPNRDRQAKDCLFTHNNTLIHEMDAVINIAWSLSSPDGYSMYSVVNAANKSSLTSRTPPKALGSFSCEVMRMLKNVTRTMSLIVQKQIASDEAALFRLPSHDRINGFPVWWDVTLLHNGIMDITPAFKPLGIQIEYYESDERINATLRFTRLSAENAGVYRCTLCFGDVRHIIKTTATWQLCQEDVKVFMKMLMPGDMPVNLAMNQIHLSGSIDKFDWQNSSACLNSSLILDLDNAGWEVMPVDIKIIKDDQVFSLQSADPARRLILLHRETERFVNNKELPAQRFLTWSTSLVLCSAYQDSMLDESLLVEISFRDEKNQLVWNISKIPILMTSASKRLRRDSFTSNYDGLHGNWLCGACSKTCGWGITSCTRDCWGTPGSCNVELAMQQGCFERKCFVESVWGPWSEWSQCLTRERSCGLYPRYRFRACLKPPEEFITTECGGKITPYASYEQIDCNLPPCPNVNCLTSPELCQTNWKYCPEGVCVDYCMSDELCGPSQACDHLTGLCRPKCTKTSDCGIAQGCMGENCVDLCLRDLDCGTNNMLCSVDGYCLPYTNVTVRKQCQALFASDYTTYKGICHKICRTASDCLPEIPCPKEVGVCTRNTNYTCEPDQIDYCPRHTSDCYWDKSCRRKETTWLSRNCDSKNCPNIVYPPVGCLTTPSCGNTEVCFYGFCTCIKLYNGKCQEKSIGSSCLSDRNCTQLHPNAVCNPFSKSCQCISTHFLVNHHCMERYTMLVCKENKECLRGYICVNTLCVKPCLVNADCKTDSLVCANGACSLPCKTNSECMIGQVCQRDGSCAQSCINDLERITRCDDVHQRCIGQTCLKRCPCSPHQLCENGVCLTKCRSDADCMLGESCVATSCKPQCSLKRKCPIGQTCVQGYCYSTCREPGDCGHAETFCTYGLTIVGYDRIGICTNMDYIRPRERIVPRFHQECINIEQGLRIRYFCSHACESDADCGPEGTSCINGICSLVCNSNNDCFFSVCHFVDTHLKACMQFCNSTVSCGSNRICIKPPNCSNCTNVCAGVSTLTCRLDLDCQFISNTKPFFCEKVTGKCKSDDRRGFHCNNTSTCGSGEYCGDGVCRCYKYNDGTCVGSLRPLQVESNSPKPCRMFAIHGLAYDMDSGACKCDQGSVLWGGRCVSLGKPLSDTTKVYQGCSLDGDCVDGTTCIANRCRRQCTTICDFSLVCSHSLCTKPCNDNSECGYGEVCSSRKLCDIKCETDFISSMQCGKHQQCIDGICVEYWNIPTTCTEGEVLISSEGYCTPKCFQDGDCLTGACVGKICGSKCTASSVCPQYRTCIGGECLYKCPCPLGFTCVETVCFPMCKSQSECDQGFACVNGICLGLCIENFQCPNSMTCSHSLCAFKCSNTVQCPLGFTCSFDGHCDVACNPRKDTCGVLHTCHSTSVCVRNEYRPCGILCPIGYICADGLCKPMVQAGMACRYRSDCGINEICDNQICKARKTFDGKDMGPPQNYIKTYKVLDELQDCSYEWACPENFFCSSHRCYPGCAASWPIIRGYRSPNACANGLRTLLCLRDSDCDSYQRCIQKQCTNTCPYCPSFQECYAGICLQKADSNVTCNMYQSVWSGGLCKDICIHDSECNYGVCSHGVCDMTCSSREPCQKGLTCLQGRCITECEDDTHCGYYQTCLYGFCHRKCLSGSIENCDNIPATCDYQFDCGDGDLVCSNGICTPNSRRYKCTSGWIPDPISLGCLKPCNNTAVCFNSDFYCGDGTCRTKAGHLACRNATDCNSDNLFCLAGNCRRISRVGLSCSSVIRPCGMFEDCVHGVCECTKNAKGVCIGLPPTKCDSGAECLLTFTCDKANRLCTCPADAVVVGLMCMSTHTSTNDSSGSYFSNCISDVDCPEDSECQAQNCYPRCSGNICPYKLMHMTCHLGLCAMFCSKDAECDRNQMCWRRPTTISETHGICISLCKYNKDCPTSQICANGVCSHTCISNSNCPDGFMCYSQKCVMVGSADSDCKYGIHSEGLCSPLCTNDNDCGMKQVCQKRKCLNKCADDTVLPSDQTCVMGLSVKICQPSLFGQTCGDQCWSHSDCGTGHICVEGLCTIYCLYDNECPKSLNFGCLPGIGCVYKCSTDRDCNPNQKCTVSLDHRLRYCASYDGLPCRSDDECGSSHFCQDKSGCVPLSKIHSRCAMDSDCGLNEYCEGLHCTCMKDSDGSCLPNAIKCVGSLPCHVFISGSTCDVQHNWCVCPDGMHQISYRCVKTDALFCSESTSCIIGDQCVRNLCYQKCGPPNGCPDGLRCMNGLCGLRCQNSSECANYHTCRCGQCMLTCDRPDQCADHQSCFRGICRKSCLSDGDCFDSYICKNKVCLLNCTKPDCEVKNNLTETCDCELTKSDDSCVGGDIVCLGVGDANFTGSISEVQQTNNTSVITSETCNSHGGVCDKNICVCKPGLIRYAGGVCQHNLEACDKLSGCHHAVCIENYCIPNCDRPCKLGLTCEDGLCPIPCISTKQCVNGGECANGRCTTTAKKDMPVGPECVGNETCLDIFETCDASRKQCLCSTATARSSKTGLCSWYMDRVCFGCLPCTNSCPGKNFICNRGVGVCVCEYGYTLNKAGTSCVRDTTVHDMTAIDCRTIKDCNQLPNSICHSSDGKCQCKQSYCYINGTCLPDVDECFGLTCPLGFACQNLPCRSSYERPRCVEDRLLRARAWFNTQCNNSEDCALLLNTYCYQRRCTCITGSIILEDECVAGYTCDMDADCREGRVCRGKVCVHLYEAVKPGAAMAPSTAKNKPSTNLLIFIILGTIGLAILWVAVAMVVYKNYKKSKEGKEKTHEEALAAEARAVERQASVAFKKQSVAKVIHEVEVLEDAYKAPVEVASIDIDVIKVPNESLGNLPHGSKSQQPEKTGSATTELKQTTNTPKNQQLEIKKNTAVKSAPAPTKSKPKPK